MKNSKSKNQPKIRSQKLHKGDEVKVTIGKDKGKIGKIDKIFPKIGKILVGGVNLYKRHLKARAQNQKSEIITKALPISLSRVSLICPKCHLATRIGFLIENGKKVRICKKCKQVV